MSLWCACLIVVLHSGIAARFGSISWYAEQLIRECCRIAVPWFFLAAGYFLSRHCLEVGWWKRETGKRVRTLLVPLWIWSAVGLLLLLIVHWGMCIVGHRLQQADAIDGWGWESALTLTGLNFWANMGPLWFVRTLFVLVCLSPLFAFSGRFVGGIRLIVLALLYSVSVFVLQDGTMSWTFFEYGVSLRGMFYFAVGMHFQRYPLEIEKRKTAILLAGMLSMALLALYLTYPIFSLGIDLVLVPPLMYFTYNVARGARFAHYSFPIYLMHGIFLTIFSCGLGLFGVRTTSLESLWWHFGRAAFAIVCSIVAARALRRLAPKFANIAFGGR